MLNVLLSGQANALGRRAGGLPFAACDAGVKVWNNINPAGASGSEWVRPREARPPFHLESHHGNLGVWFAHHAARRLRQPVRLTVVANPAASMVEWFPGHGSMFGTIAQVFKEQGGEPYDVMLWQHGERDRGCDASWYREAVEWLVSALREEAVLKQTAPVMLGGLASPLDGCVNHALRQAAREHALMRFVDVAGLPTEGGLEHFSGAGLAELGERFFQAFHPQRTPTGGSAPVRRVVGRP